MLGGQTKVESPGGISTVEMAPIRGLLIPIQHCLGKAHGMQRKISYVLLLVDSWMQQILSVMLMWEIVQQD